jgi:flagellar biosynthesis/type III secretory pathway protein FliH
VRSRARVIRGEAALGARPLLPRDAVAVRRQRVPREEMDARIEAERLLREAREAAAAIVAEARARAADAAATVSREAHEAAAAALAARWLAVRQGEEKARGRERDRVVALAVALGERLLGASLAIDPAGIASLASAVFEETRGARRAVIDAHPLDADELKRQLASGALDLGVVEVRGDETLARGELRLHTDIGSIDARLAPRFDRLAAAVRDALE